MLLAACALWLVLSLLALVLLRLERIYQTTSSNDAAVSAIDQLLPQLQCGLCGYPGCKPYAQALFAGEAAINQCPPGGEELVQSLRVLLGAESAPAVEEFAEDQVALVDEQRCIGCFRCVQACPVDAIIGAPEMMHTVLAAECTGCKLCLPVCPVDCIDMVIAPATNAPRTHL